MLEKLLIIGAGGLGRMTMEAASERYECYFIDDAYDEGKTSSGVPILGTTNTLEKLKGEFSNAICAIGLNSLRENINNKLKKLGFNIPTIISSKAYISPFSTIGKGSIVLPNACIQNGSTVGEGTVICSLVEVHHDSLIGDFSLVYPNSTIRTFVKIGNRVKIGSNVSISNEVEISDDTVIENGQVINLEKDYCCVCKNETEYYVSTNIEERIHYVPGVGQLCRKCWEDLYGKKKEEWIESEDFLPKK